jgi:hypothetical protein
MTCSGANNCTSLNVTKNATYTSPRLCNFTRLLCVKCAQYKNLTTYIRVISNGLPNHCFNTTKNVTVTMVDF